MTIEIHSPNLKVSKDDLDVTRRKVLTLSHLSEKISSAEVFLSEDESLMKENEVCKSRLNIFDDTIFVHKNADRFANAAASSVKILRRRLKRKSERRNEPPGERISTVRT